jgi:Fic family protein
MDPFAPAAPPRLDPRLARRLSDKKRELDRYRPLRPDVMRRLQDDLRVLLTYHSNALEGNTLSLRETQLVIEYGLTVGGHSLREYLEATNHAAAFAELVQLADATTPVTLDTIVRLHYLVMQQILPQAGQWRRVPVTIRGVALVPPAAARVPALMAEWVAWVNEAWQAYDPVVRAAIAHHGFEAVHPFEDGNGRVGRLLLNLLLLRDGYTPALLLRDWRVSYLQGLAAADRGQYTPLANLVGRAVEQGLDRYLAVCRTAPESEYLPLADLAERTGYDRAHLGWLIRQGRLAGEKRGGRWYSTVDAVAQYTDDIAQGRFPPGRPRHSQESKHMKNS